MRNLSVSGVSNYVTFEVCRIPLLILFLEADSYIDLKSF